MAGAEAAPDRAGAFNSQADAPTTTAPPNNQFARSGWTKASATRTAIATPTLAPTVQKRDVEIGATGDGETS